MNGNSLIVHQNFIEYTGDVIETVEKMENNLILHEIHMDLKKPIFDSDFKKCFSEVSKPKIKIQIFQLVIPVFEFKHYLFQNSILIYMRSITKSLKKLSKLIKNLAIKSI